MPLPAAAIPLLGTIISKIIDKVAKDKVDDETLERLKLEAIKAAQEDEQELTELFYNFMIDYEGKAEELPKSIQFLRGLVRPLVTYVTNGAFFWIVYHWMTGINLPEGSEMGVKVVFIMTLLVNTFWFGEKMVTRTGFDVFLRGFFDAKK